MNYRWHHNVRYAPEFRQRACKILVRSKSDHADDENSHGYARARAVNMPRTRHFSFKSLLNQVASEFDVVQTHEKLTQASRRGVETLDPVTLQPHVVTKNS
ncbi:hypothetical protein J1N35_043608 [Gossypium stocksii]|uniref:Uncharacterized protein n=1 Tax=Gossypium stocksii TaxID=47602 RepID=A0A9D3U7T5_9ROSI|nr:hypothetical protein J1N35_043608 [Gossypium stocksii]